MDPCAACLALDKKLSNEPPHAALKHISSSPVTYPAGGTSIYECKTCGARFIRDVDKHDRGALWEIDSHR